MTENLLAATEHRLAELRAQVSQANGAPGVQSPEYEIHEEHEIKATEGSVQAGSPGTLRDDKYEKHEFRRAPIPIRVGQRWAIRADGDPWKLRRGGEVLEITAVIGDAIGHRFAVLGIRGVMRLVDLRERCTLVPAHAETI
jgi:hypothetical protein